jgi:hypothetical protein
VITATLNSVSCLYKSGDFRLRPVSASRPFLIFPIFGLKVENITEPSVFNGLRTIYDYPQVHGLQERYP